MRTPARTFTFLAVVAALTLGCTSASSGQQLDTSPPDVPVADAPDARGAPAVPTAEQPQESRLRGDNIVLRRRGGAGAVLYEIELTPDGAVHWDGRNRVAELGKATAKAAEVDFDAMLSTLASVDADHRAELNDCSARGSLDDDGFEIVVGDGTDHPTLFVVPMDPSCPDSAAAKVLRGLQTSIVQLADTHGWIGASK